MKSLGAQLGAWCPYVDPPGAKLLADTNVVLASTKRKPRTGQITLGTHVSRGIPPLSPATGPGTGQRRGFFAARCWPGRRDMAAVGLFPDSHRAPLGGDGAPLQQADGAGSGTVDRRG